jgi:hypothetical protein
MRRSVALLALGILTFAPRAASAQIAVQPGTKGSTVVSDTFTQTCAGTGQVCGKPIGLPVGLFKGGRVDLSYTAPNTHCSDVRVHFFLDGTEVGVTPFTKPDGVVKATIRLKRRGSGQLRFDGEGRTGGCNAGALISWGGRLELAATPNLCLGRAVTQVTVPATGGTVIHMTGATVEAAAAGSQTFVPVARNMVMPAAGFQVRTDETSIGEIRTADGRLYVIAPGSVVTTAEGSPALRTKLVPTATTTEEILTRIHRFRHGPGAYGVRPCS